MKKIISQKELRNTMKKAVSEVAGIVKKTLGPGGRPILIERSGQGQDGMPLGPRITKDGVSVANECFSANREKDLIIQAVKTICKKTNRVAGDGTTTAIVLGEAILNETLRYLMLNPGENPQIVREVIEAESRVIIDKIKEMSVPVDNMDLIEKVATISANGDKEIGGILRDAFSEVGAEGVVTVDEGHTNKLSLEVVDGYQFQRGAESRDRFFNNAEMTKFEVEGAAVLLYDGKLQSYTDLLPPLNVLAGVDQNGKPTKKLPPIVIVANEFSKEIIQFLLIQKAEMGMQFCCVKGPHQTSVRTGYYDDMAVLFGGYRFGNSNKSLSNFKEDDHGLVGKVIIDKYTTTFYNGQGSEEDIIARVEQLKAQKDLAESPYDAQVISDRIAALTGGIAKIGVGGATDFEIKEKYDRIEDALNASRAAIEKGIIPGGGTTLYRLSEQTDHPILKKALKAPFDQILENIGVQPMEPVEVLSKQSVFDARNKEWVDYLESGIVDPAKVTISALENAISISSLLSTAGGGIIFQAPDK